MIEASREGHVAVVKLLLDHGANVAATGNVSTTLTIVGALQPPLDNL